MCQNNCPQPCECQDLCGCPQQIKGNCVFYQGLPLPCISATKGDPYDTILANINNAICNIAPPSGIVYTGASGQITVTSNVIGLDPAITTEISNIQNDISAIETCLGTTVKDITSSSLTVTTGSVTSCGRTINIEYAASPVTNSQKSGVLLNIFNSPTVTTGYFQSLDLTSYSLKAGDIITFKGTIRRNLSMCNIQEIRITDGTAYNQFTSIGGSQAVCNIFSITDFEIISTVVADATSTLQLKNYAKIDTLLSKPGAPKYGESIVSNLSEIYQYTTPVTINTNDVRIAIDPHGDSVILDQLIIKLERKI